MAMNRKFIVSGRALNKPILDSITTRYRRFLGHGIIDSVFGFAVGHSPLYGGRPYREEDCLPEDQINQLMNYNIGFELTLSSHYFSDDLYKKTIPILERFEHQRNGVICVNDNLAKRIKQDFPLYTVRASAIKKIGSHRQIEQALELYDSITLPPWIVDKGDSFLQKIEAKNRIVLFLTMRCGYFCREKDEDRCYQHFSDYNLNLSGNFQTLSCMQQLEGQRKVPDQFIELDINDPIFEGFTYFKLIQEIDPSGNKSIGKSEYRFSKLQQRKLNKLPIANKN